jgi:hypothetical protein
MMTLSKGGYWMIYKKIVLTLGFLLFGFMSVETVEILVQPEVVEASVFNTKVSADVTSNQSNGIASKILDFANVFAGIVLALSIVAMIAGSIQLSWRLEAGVQWHRDSKAKVTVMYSGIGIIIALSAFAILRLFEGFAVT